MHALEWETGSGMIEVGRRLDGNEFSASVAFAAGHPDALPVRIP